MESERIHGLRKIRPALLSGSSAAEYDHKEAFDRIFIMEQRITGTVVSVEAQELNVCSVEIVCEALEDATAFQIVSTDLPFEHVALKRAAGSRLNLICVPGSKINVGDKVKVVVRPLEASELRRRQAENALRRGG